MKNQPMRNLQRSFQVLAVLACLLPVPALRGATWTVTSTADSTSAAASISPRFQKSSLKRFYGLSFGPNGQAARASGAFEGKLKPQ
jgi:hypothetical protein